jgi:hypothetical protein
MIQEVIVGIVFLAALGYAGRLVYRSFQAKHACSSGCGKCATVDAEKSRA